MIIDIHADTLISLSLSSDDQHQNNMINRAELVINLYNHSYCTIIVWFLLVFSFYSQFSSKIESSVATAGRKMAVFRGVKSVRQGQGFKFPSLKHISVSYITESMYESSAVDSIILRRTEPRTSFLTYNQILCCDHLVEKKKINWCSPAFFE